MRRTILTFVFLLFGTVAAHANNACDQQIPYGLPSIRENVTLLCRYAYVSAHDNTAKIPVWVAYLVEPKNAIGCVPRSDRFIPDTTLPEQARSRPDDYADSGYDIGHMADAASMSWSSQAELESFILSNAAPQNPNLNRGIWRLLEIKIRVWAYAGRSMRVYTGGIWDHESERIGRGVVVPDRYYKIVVDNTTGESIAFLFDNEPQTQKNLAKFIVSVAEIEQATGLRFPITGDKSQINQLWPADIKRLIEGKRAKCKVN